MRWNVCVNSPAIGFLPLLVSSPPACKQSHLYDLRCARLSRVGRRCSCYKARGGRILEGARSLSLWLRRWQGTSLRWGGGVSWTLHGERCLIALLFAIRFLCVRDHQWNVIDAMHSTETPALNDFLPSKPRVSPFLLSTSPSICRKGECPPRRGAWDPCLCSAERDPRPPLKMKISNNYRSQQCPQDGLVRMQTRKKKQCQKPHQIVHESLLNLWSMTFLFLNPNICSLTP